VGPAVRKDIELGKYSGKNAIDVLADFGVAETKGRVTALLVQAITKSVLFGIVRVAVDFHDQPLRGTKEIDDAVGNDMLPAEFMTAKLGSRDAAPQLRFEGRRAIPQPSGSFD
jgi:hypothetical protein